MTHRAFKEDVRYRMARTGEKYTEARRAIEEIHAAPPADVYTPTWGEAYYFVDPYDHTPYGPYGNVLAYADETDDTYEGLLSADGDGIEWETLALRCSQLTRWSPDDEAATTGESVTRCRGVA